MHPSKRLLMTFGLLAAATASLSAQSFSYTGTFSSSEDVFETSFTLASANTVTFQTYGFGGGTNAAGHPVSAGGFDPLITLFSGPVATATVVTDTFGDPLADADNLYNPPWSYVGNCPTAGTVAIGSDNDCGDDFLQATLAAGTYTLVLTDADYIPAAVYDNGALAEGFVDFTGGAFQTCDSVSNTCIFPNGNYAVDILIGQASAATPDPSTFSLLCIGLSAIAGAKRLHLPSRRSRGQSK